MPHLGKPPVHVIGGADMTPSSRERGAASRSLDSRGWRLSGGRSTSNASIAAGLVLIGLVGSTACQPSTQPVVVDAFDCEYIANSGFPLAGAPLDGDIGLEFTDGQFGHGTAPRQLKGQVVSAGPNWLQIVACGRDTQNREWQISASWMYLPLPYPPAYPLDFPAGPSWSGPVGNEVALPGFGVTLELCGPSCVTREWVAYDGPFFPNSSIKGSAHIEAYDFCTGNFYGSGELNQTSQSRMAEGPMNLNVNGTWTPDDRFYTGIVGEESGHPVNTICPTGSMGASGAGVGGASNTPGENGGGGASSN
jgi:hypothetical protein